MDKKKKQLEERHGIGESIPNKLVSGTAVPAKDLQPLSWVHLEYLEERVLYSADLPGANLTEHLLTETDIVLPDDISDFGFEREISVTSTELVFIDTALPLRETLISDLVDQQNSGRQLHIIDIHSDEDGINTISQTLADHDHVSAIHVLTHGTTSTVQLGSVWLTADNIDSYTHKLTQWQQSLTDTADILFYGCNLAGSENGLELISKIAQQTDADVAASIDTTGHDNLLANWTLEQATGHVDAAVAISEQAQNDWEELLAGLTGNDILNPAPNYTSLEFTEAELLSNDAPDEPNFVVALQPDHGTISPSDTAADTHIYKPPSTAYEGPVNFDYVVTDNAYEDNIVHRWMLDEINAGITLDINGDHDGVIKGNPTEQGTGTESDPTRLKFDGVDDYIEIDRPNYGDSFSISFDFKLGEINSNFDSQQFLDQGSFALLEAAPYAVTEPGTIGVWAGNGENTLLWGTNLVTSLRGMNDSFNQQVIWKYDLVTADKNYFGDGLWHNYTLVVDDNANPRTSVYLDGELIHSDDVGRGGFNNTTSTLPKSDKLLVGHFEDEYLYGSYIKDHQMRDLRIYDTPISFETGSVTVELYDPNPSLSLSANSVVLAEGENKSVPVSFTSGSAPYNLTTQVTTSNGTLDIDTSNVNITNGLPGTTEITIEGNAQDIAASLNTLQYHTTNNFNGSDIVSVQVNAELLSAIDNRSGNQFDENNNLIGNDDSLFITDPIRGEVLSIENGEYIEIPDIASNNPQSLTLIARINPATSNAEIINLGGVAGIRIESNRVEGYFEHNGITHVLPANTPISSGWQHIAFVVEKGFQQLFVNGLLVAQSDLGSSGTLIDYTATTPFATVGIHADKTNKAYSGQIDDAYIFSRALTINEITELANDNAIPGVTKNIDITVTPINDAPVFDTPASVTLTPIDEDSNNNSGDKISDLITLITEDSDGPGAGIAVIYTDSSEGSWEYSNNNGTDWWSMGNPTPDAALLLPDSAKIRFEPDTGTHFNGTVRIEFHAWDNSQGAATDQFDITANGTGGTTAFSIDTKTANIIVNPVNDVPTTSNISISDVEDPQSPTPILLVGSDIEGGIDSFVLQSLPDNGILYLDAAKTYPVFPGIPLAIDTQQTSAPLPAIPASLTLFFSPNENWNGATSFKYSARDNGGLQDSTSAEVTIEISSVEDQPELLITTENSPIYNENDPALALVNSAYVSDSDESDLVLVTLSAAPFPAASGNEIIVDGLSEIVIFTAGSAKTGVIKIGNTDFYYNFDGHTLFTFNNNTPGPLPVEDIELLIASINYRNISENPTPGTGSFEFTLTDSGGNNSVINTANLEVAPVNDAPFLNNGLTRNFAPIEEDQYFSNPNSVASLIESAVFDADDAAGTSVAGIAIVATDSVNGEWQYRTDSGNTWTTIDTATESTALLLNATDQVQFVPAENFHGTAEIEFKAWDTSSGTAGTTTDVSTSGNTTAFSLNNATATIEISAVNDPPHLTSITSTTTFVEFGNPVILAPDITLSDIEADLSGSYDGSAIGLMRVAISSSSNSDQAASANSTDIFGLQDGSNYQELTESDTVTDSSGTQIANVTEHSDGKLRLTFNELADSTNISELLRKITYKNTSASPPDGVSIEWKFTDTGIDNNGIIASTAESTGLITDVLISHQNQPPVLNTNVQARTAFGDVLPISPLMLETTDPDDAASSIEYQLLNTNSSGIGQLQWFNGANWQPVSQIGIDRFSQYDLNNGLLRYLANPSTGATEATERLEFLITDSSDNLVQDANGNTLNTVTFTIDIENSNASQISSLTPTQYIENQEAISISSEVVIDPNGNTTLAGAIIELSEGFSDNGQEYLTFTLQGGISDDFNPATGTLFLSGHAAIADYQSVLRSLTYTNTSDNPSTSTRFFSISLFDGKSYSDKVTSEIAVIAINDAPVLDNSSVVVLNSISGDQDVSSNTGETISSILTKDPARYTDVDTADTRGIAVISTEETNGIWEYLSSDGLSWKTMNNPSPASALLLPDTSSVRFLPNTEFLGTASIKFHGWDATDGTHGTPYNVTASGTGTTFPFSADVLSAIIEVTSVNDEPQTNDVFTTENEDTVASIVLEGSDTDGFVSSFLINSLPLNGSLFLTPATTQKVEIGAQYTAINQKLDLYFRPDHNWHGETTFTYLANDNNNLKSTEPAKATIIIDSINDKPALLQGNTAELNFVENDSAIPLYPFVTIDDSNENDIKAIFLDAPSFLTDVRNEISIAGSTISTVTPYSSVVTIGSTDFNTLFDPASERFSFKNISGNAIPTDDVNWFIRSIHYKNSGENPIFGSMLFALTLEDMDNQLSTIERKTVNITTVNDAPILNEAAIENFTTVAEDTVLPEGNSVAHIIAQAYSDVDGDPKGIAITSADNANGIWEYSADGSVAWQTVGSPEVTSALLLSDTAKIRFLPEADYYGTASIELKAWDRKHGVSGEFHDASTYSDTGAFSLQSSSAQIIVHPMDDAPLIENIEQSQAQFTEGADPVPISDTLTITEKDAEPIQSAKIQITGNYSADEDELLFDGADLSSSFASGTSLPTITADYQAFTGTLTLTGPATAEVYQAALRHVVYNNTSEDPNAGTRTVSLTVFDENGQSNQLTRDIDITPVNDPPSAVNTTINIPSDRSHTFSLQNFVYSDVENHQLMSVIIDALPQNGVLQLGENTIAELQEIPRSDIESGALRYQPDDTFAGTDTILFTIKDNGGISNQGQNKDTNSHSMSIEVTKVTDVPVTNNPPTDTPVTSNPPTDTPVTSNPPTDTPVPTNPPTDTPVTSNPPTDSPVTDNVDQPTVAAAYANTTAIPKPEPVPEQQESPDEDKSLASSQPKPQAQKSTVNSVPQDSKQEVSTDISEAIIVHEPEQRHSPIADLIEMTTKPRTIKPVAVTESANFVETDELPPLTDEIIASPESAMLNSKNFLNHLDQQRDDLQSTTIEKLTVASAVSATTGLTVGYVIWLLRSGLLLSSVLSTLPAWRNIDPLPVLSTLDNTSETQDDDSLENIVTAQKERS